jgi:Predicted RNA-binding protein homologous to eukaryotic snRNP
MSLNWKEIDLVLSELDIVGAKIERITQPGYDSLCLGLYKAGAETNLFFSIAQGACRLHALSSAPPKADRPLRFMECLKSRIRGGRIEGIEQLGSERVVKLRVCATRSIDFRDRDPESGVGIALREYLLYARLWSGAGNIVLVDSEGLVVDALARRPKRGEVSGERCAIEEELRAAAERREASRRAGGPEREFEVRDLPGEGGFNARVEAYYSEKVGQLSRESLLEAARERFGKRSRALEARIAELDAKAEEFRDADRLRELGDILMANQGAPISRGRVLCEDFYRGGEVDIPVDPGLSIVENARRLYERHKKARSGLADVEAELEAAKTSLDRLTRELEALEAEADPFAIAKALAKGGAAKAPSGGGARERAYPGLSLERSGWTILVGRTAKENDELLRRHVSGADLWLHARDWPGSYVFVKARKGKTVPLEILLDAGNLAIYYSKGRANGVGNLYYTYAKYLRRAKDGPQGTVLPSHEKNLSVQLDEARLKELRALIGEDEPSPLARD